MRKAPKRGRIAATDVTAEPVVMTKRVAGAKTRSELIWVGMSLLPSVLSVRSVGTSHLSSPFLETAEPFQFSPPEAVD